MLYLLSYDRHMSEALYGIWSAVGKVNLFFFILEQWGAMCGWIG